MGCVRITSLSLSWHDSLTIMTEYVMRNGNKRNGTNIFVNDDLCPASQAVQNAQMPCLKQARDQGKIAFFRRTKLIVVKERYNNEDVGGG